MRTALTMGLALAACAALAWAAPGEYIFTTDRDGLVDENCWGGNAGADGYGRGCKKYFEDNSLFHFSFGNFTEAYGGVDNIESATFNIRVKIGTGNNRPALGTIQSETDWAEGNGLGAMSGQWDWSANTPAVTHYWAQAYWRLNGAVKEVDPDRTISWIRPSDHLAVRLEDLGAGTVNSNKFPTLLGGAWGNVILDQNYLTTLLTDPNCRGIMLWLPVVPSEPDNPIWEVFFKETANSAAYVQIKLFDRLGDTNYDRAVDYLDLGALAAHYRQVGGADWTMGDFDKNGDVDYLDLGILAGVYRSTDPPIYTPPGPPIPEPISLLLLASLVPLLRRR